MDDWAQLFQHALNAEVAPEFQRWLAASDWRWAPSPGSRLESQVSQRRKRILRNVLKRQG